MAGKSAGINSATVSKKKKAMENQPPKGDSRNFNTVFIKTTTLAQKLRNNKISSWGTKNAVYSKLSSEVCKNSVPLDVQKVLEINNSKSFDKSNLIIKGNPNLQGTLNWIVQIFFYYHCSQQHKKYRKLSLLNKLSLSLSTILSVYCTLFFICLSQRQIFFGSSKPYSMQF